MLSLSKHEDNRRAGPGAWNWAPFRAPILDSSDRANAISAAPAEGRALAISAILGP